MGSGKAQGMFRLVGLAVVVAIAVGGALVVGTASAAKPEPFIIQLDCGEHGSFDVRLVGRDSDWTPGLIVGGGAIVPKAFANQHEIFTDNEGNVFEDFPPDIAKPGNHGNLVTCAFEVNFEDENGSGSASGDVTGLLVGVH